MNTIAVSVIMPVYNAEAFISQSIDSILGQTFIDFEFIIINDGSTDRSKEIIKSYSDKRIVYLENEINQGLVFTLNRGIAAVKGEYIARMDSDDICLPERLETQKKFLDQHVEIALVASPVIFIDGNNNKTGIWELDNKTKLPLQIRKTMLRENCIAHPSIMIRATILKEFQYKPYQKNIEDYDLWLRLLNSKYKLAKTETPLLLYRVHESSITNTALKNKNFFFKHAVMKRKFLWNEIKKGRVNGYTIKVIASLFIDLLKGTGKSIKRIFQS